MLTTLIFFIKNFDQKSITDTMNKEIPKVTEWFNSNKLNINTQRLPCFFTQDRTLAINESDKNKR